MSDDATVDTVSAEAWATARPWNELRVGREGNGSPRSHEEQLCNADGEGVVILTHDGSAEARANVALMMRAVNERDGLIAARDEARNLAVRAGEVIERQARMLVRAPSFDDAIHLLLGAIVEPATDAPNCAEWCGSMGGRQFVLSLQWADGKSPQELLSEATADRDTQLAIIAGRAKAPTRSEFAAHFSVGGGWLFAWYSEAGPATAVVFDEASARRALVEASWLDGLYLVLPLGSDRRPCAWPVVEASRG